MAEVSGGDAGVSIERGTLYLVATPIGNLGDFSPRARQVLAAVDRVLAEDTRVSRRLLSHFGITTPLLACHEHNEERLVPELIRQLREGASLALIPDAGMPLVSDPGYRLVRAAHQSGVPVRVVPGPSAPLAALAGSGLPTDRFTFEGFLPARHGPRLRRLQALAGEPRTLILLETGRRLADALEDLVRAFGPQREVCLARELTKVHETFILSTSAELSRRVREEPEQQRGEVVLVVAGAPEETGDEGRAREALALALEHLPASRAAALVSRLTGIPRSRIYGWIQGD
ncbi:MAG: 16S rRNA (cytidine(1402)-2'-O)-methyltransferase [Gammaproteobacteria bacterium]|nr:MAG: 16S rRNA (cytidine(1402)-2'-O)-methyltransferase [Gammaproteobacteria bacterium]